MVDVFGNVVVPREVEEVGVRPIAVGEFLRRLIGKVVMRHSLVRKAAASLRPVQCGVGVSNACPLLAMTAQQWAGLGTAPAPWCFLQIDLSNAFNSLSRGKLLMATAVRCPEMMPWMLTCYGAHSPLLCGSDTICSQTGLQQGDPCGPLGFCLGVQDLLKRVGHLVQWLMACY